MQLPAPPPYIRGASPLEVAYDYFVRHKRRKALPVREFADPRPRSPMPDPDPRSPEALESIHLEGSRARRGVDRRALLLSRSSSRPSSRAPPYTVVSREARRPLATRVIGGQEMFALDDLARLFNLTVREDTAAGALTVTAGAQTIVLSPQQPLASVAGRMISLPAAPVARRPRVVRAGGLRQPRPRARSSPRGSSCASRRG